MLRPSRSPVFPNGAQMVYQWSTDMQPPIPATVPALSRAAELAYERMSEMIATRRLGPDSPVTERRLATEFGLSRTPLREALRRLEGEGVLTRRGDGTLAVRKLDVEETLEVLAVRRLLEPEAAAAAAGKVAPDVLAGLEARVHALLASGDPPISERLSVDLELHAAIGEGCGNATLAAIVADLRRRILLYATRRVPERLEPVCAEHIAILAALRSGDADRARRVMAAHVDGTRDGILRRLRGD